MKGRNAKTGPRTRGKKAAASRGAKVAAATAKAKAQRAKSTAKTKASNRTPSRRAAPNPLIEPWTTPFEMPPFDRIRPEHFLPAFDRVFADNIAEIEAI